MNKIKLPEKLGQLTKKEVLDKVKSILETTKGVAKQCYKGKDQEKLNEGIRAWVFHIACEELTTKFEPDIGEVVEMERHDLEDVMVELVVFLDKYYPCKKKWHEIILSWEGTEKGDD